MFFWYLSFIDPDQLWSGSLVDTGGFASAVANQFNRMLQSNKN